MVSHWGHMCSGDKDGWMGSISIAKMLPLFLHKHPQNIYNVNKASVKEKEARPNLWPYYIKNKQMWVCFLADTIMKTGHQKIFFIRCTQLILRLPKMGREEKEASKGNFSFWWGLELYSCSTALEEVWQFQKKSRPLSLKYHYPVISSPSASIEIEVFQRWFFKIHLHIHTHKNTHSNPPPCINA